MENPKAPEVIGIAVNRLKEEKLKRENFYQDFNDDQKVEFILGNVIVHSPVKIEHTIVSKNLLKLLDTFVAIKDLGYVGFEKSLVSFTRNDYEPDICFFRKEISKHFKKAQWKLPVPDLIVEVLSKSMEKIDRGIKFEDYEAHGVKEYWIIDPVQKVVEQYILKEGKYQLAVKAKDAVISSEVVTGFKIQINAILNEVKNIEELQKLLNK